ncbi:MAG TPA: TSUP family transporter, partial [Bradyrhizobium sp.]|nr:TSUP family transporter [Bradyrhizobium sp.]
MAIGSALQASVGIGLALLVVPVLALVDQSFIPGPMLLAGVALTVLTAWRERTAIDVPALRNSLIGLAIGTILGALALGFAFGPQLDRIFGGLVLLAV